jgi:hypothetical protein
MGYRGPAGVEAALERSVGADLHRELGFKLGPISTKFVASFTSGDEDLNLHDVTHLGFVVYEIGKHGDAARRPIRAGEIAGPGWTTMLDAHDGDGQVLLLVKSRHGSVHEMMLVAIDDDEAVVARLTGQLDRLIAKTVDGAQHEGARGARAAVGYSGHG